MEVLLEVVSSGLIVVLYVVGLSPEQAVPTGVRSACTRWNAPCETGVYA